MYKIFLSLRYLRARKTNWIGVAGIFVAVTALVLILSIMSGFLAETRKQLRGNLSDLIIEPKLELPTVDGSMLPLDPEPILEIVRADPRVESACTQLNWYGILAQPGQTMKLTTQGIALVNLLGVDVEDEFTTTGLRDALTKEPRGTARRPEDIERPFEPPPNYKPRGRALPSVLVGEQLAWVWGLRRGSEIELITTTVDPHTGDVAEPSNRRYVVAGSFRSGENELDMERIYLERSELNSFLSEKAPFSKVLVKLKNYSADAEAVKRDLKDKLYAAGLIHNPELFGEVRSWEDERVNLLAAIENEKTLMGIMLWLVMVVAGFTVFALLSMSVTEKRRDIGILTALGGSSQGVMVMFLMIGFWEALIGVALGMTAGIWGAIKIDSIERWLSKTFNIQIFNRDVYLFDHIPSVVEPLGVVLIGAGAFALTLIFAAIPAWRAARLHPIDALRYE